MRSTSFLVAAATLALTGCGSGDGSTTPPATSTASSSGSFNPPAPPAGYTRLTAATIKDVPPGGDVTYCQYAMAPVDHDMDVLDIAGVQSKFGHHAVAFSYKDDGTQVVGASVPCMGTEVSSGVGASGSTPAGSLNMGTFLGGVGGDAARETSASTLPAGVAFRLQKGYGIMLNIHFLNTGSDTIDGNAVIDVKLADADPNRLIAAMFLTLDFGFDLLPNAQTDSSVQCVVGSEVPLVMMANHMHDYGTAVTTEVQRAGTDAFETLHADPKWTYDMQFNAVYSKFTVDAPYVLHTGDTIRTTCSWENTSSTDVKFPREMCIGVGFALASGDNPTAPVCMNGTWIPAPAAPAPM